MLEKITGKRTIEQKIKFGFSAALLLLLFVSVLAVGSIYSLHQNSQWVEHSHEVIISIEEVISLMKDAETAARGFVFTENESFLVPYFNCINNIDAALEKVNTLTKDNTEQQKRMPELIKLCNDRLEVIKTILMHYRNNEKDKVAQIIKEGNGKRLMDRIRYKISEMKAHEKLILANRRKETRISQGLTYVIIGLGNLVALLIAVAAIMNINKELGQRVIAAELLQEKQLNLEQANQELEAFSYTISHDLRSPLRAIDGFSRILQEDYNHKLDSEGQRILNVIKINATKMGKLIDDLLDFSRLNKKIPTQSNIDMQALVMEVLEEVKQSNPQMKPEIIIKPLVNALGDSALLHQVWVNLISNAFKYSSKKTPAQIEIGFVKELDKSYYYVKDNGSGFDAQYKDKLFGIFQRLHNTKDFDGNGVGLAIVQRIVQRHGGYVDAEGKLNEGAVFKFSIPTI